MSAITLLVGDVARICDPNAISVAEALARPLDGNTRLAIVCDAVSAHEFKQLTEHLRARRMTAQLTNLIKLAPAARVHNVGLVKPAFEEAMVPADKNGGASLDWYAALMNHVFGTTRPRKCCVLWGPPGVGKTLAAQRIGAMVAEQNREVSGGGDAGGERMVGADRNGVPKFRYFSCCDIGGAEDVGEFVDSVTAFATSAPDDSIFVLDDLDAVAAESTETKVVQRLLDVMASAKRCRSVVIVNDLYDYARLRPRDREEPPDFSAIQVHRAHIDSLAAYLKCKFPVMAAEPRAALLIASNSNGDVRRALTMATFDSAILTSRLYNPYARAPPRAGGAVDKKWRDQEERVEALYVQQADEIPYVSLERYARCAQPELQCRLEQMDNIEKMSQCLYTNYPRFLTAHVTRRRDARLDNIGDLAEMADWLSEGDMYERSQYSTHFAGANAAQTDKQIHFAFTLGVPITLLAHALHWLDTNYDKPPVMKFPLYTLIGAQNRLSRSLLIHRSRRRLVAETGFENAAAHMLVLDKDAHKRESAAKNMPGQTACEMQETARVLFGRLNKLALRETLLLSKQEERIDVEQAMWAELCAVTRRFGEVGFSAIDFAQACLAHFGAHEIEHTFTEYQLAGVFGETKARAARNEAVLGEQRTSIKPAAPAEPVAKKAKTQSTLDSLVKRWAKK